MTEEDYQHVLARNKPRGQSVTVNMPTVYTTERHAPVNTLQATTKYRNVKTQVDGITFDSKREAKHWQELQLRKKAGEITDLQRQVDLPLCCPSREHDGTSQVVAHYRADFIYCEKGVTHVVDAKGKRTRMYDLKKKWLYLQSGIEIEEV